MLRTLEESLREFRNDEYEIKQYGVTVLGIREDKIHDVYERVMFNMRKHGLGGYDKADEVDRDMLVLWSKMIGVNAWRDSLPQKKQVIMRNKAYIEFLGTTSFWTVSMARAGERAFIGALDRVNDIINENPDRETAIRKILDLTIEEVEIEKE